MLKQFGDGSTGAELRWLWTMKLVCLTVNLEVGQGKLKRFKFKLINKVMAND